MRSPVYRNLDKPFQILGFTPIELATLCFAFVLGGELAQFLGFDRAWALVFTLLVAATLHWFRRSMGELFGRRLLRFLQLPSELYPRLFITGRRR
ncbi:MAG: hypothetical protein KF799_15135 [Bdellovibrionales bacterium]|nr:hypothetical protein [Bdellovibrionales bacterium]